MEKTVQKTTGSRKSTGRLAVVSLIYPGSPEILIKKREKLKLKMKPKHTNNRSDRIIKACQKGR